MSDTGIGMDAETQSHIFEPFFTTKEQGKGTGLGLATVYGIVKQSGGYIWVYSELGLGTTFKIYLPRVDKMAETVTCQAIPNAARRGDETVLVVEDDTQVRAMVCHWFEHHGYSVLKAPDGQEAFELFEQHSGPVHLLVTDLVMPRMGGVKLAKALGPMQKNMKVLFLSGYSDQAVVHHGVLDESSVFLQKPFALETLSAKVTQLLDSAVQ